MKFLLLLYGDAAAEQAMTTQERRAIVGRHIEFARMLRERGVLVASEALSPGAEAAVVRRGGRVSDGPFAETKEQLGGYSIVEVGSLDEAVAIARDHPLLRVGGHSIEVRPIRELPPR